MKNFLPFGNKLDLEKSSFLGKVPTAERIIHHRLNRSKKLKKKEPNSLISNYKEEYIRFHRMKQGLKPWEGPIWQVLNKLKAG